MTTKLAILGYLRRNNYLQVTPRAALIDMDGMLYDSMPSHARAWQLMMKEIGIDFPYEEMFLHEGRTGKATINILFNRVFNRDATAEEVERLYKRKTELFASMPSVSPMPGAAQMLDFLKSVGTKRVLVTGSGQHSLIDRLNADFPGAFSPELMICGPDVTKGKPDPEPYLAAMALAGVNPWDSIVIENAPLGVEAGHRAKVFTIGVNTGPIPAEALWDAGADLVYDSMQEFADALPLLIYEFLTTLNNVN